MRIYVDFDDCICETACVLSWLADNLYGLGRPYDEIRAFDLREAFGLNEEQYRALMELAHRDEFVMNYAETSGAAGILNLWLDAGHEVEVVTGRPVLTYDASRKWLCEHGLERLPLIHVDKYNREPPCSKSVRQAQSVEEFYRREYDFAVEDSPVALRHLAKTQRCAVAVFARPWNEGAEGISPKFHRCGDWKDINAVFGNLC